ncbi:neutral zinc metallopeptidase [Rhizobium helianthi]|uniref:Neutral zinc metallopeptidase n=1 Tax=Rhizobium helianthi TaxID=1132695 RepID=A0ABW4M789_9HYPH
MRWRGREQSDNIEDRRGSRGGFRSGPGFRIPVGRRGGGGIGIGGLIVIGIICFMLGINPLTLLSGGDIGFEDGAGTRQQGQVSGRDDEMRAFVATVLRETETTWTRIFQQNGGQYQEPRLVLFSGRVDSACGLASAATGPFYCPGDRKVYLDTNFFQQLSGQLGASGDFAEAYVIAHEVGHHVQNLIGVLPRFNQMRQSMSEADANRMSVRVELQADCFAGVWGKYTDQKGILEHGDLEEALNAAQQIGDDTLQKRSQGYVVPDSFNHGTSAQRVKWFRTGFTTGNMQACDTFSPSYQQL